VHSAWLAEVTQRFGVGSAQRNAIASRLERIYRTARSTGYLLRFIVFGSFVTNCSHPNDVDLLLIMDDQFDSSMLSGEAALLFDHHAADVHFGASIFWIRRVAALGGEQAMIEYWQTKRGGGRRGIVEIVVDSNDH